MENLFTDTLIADAFITMLRYLGYIFVLAAVLIAVYFICNVPKDIYRKLLHFVAFSSTVYLVLCGKSWQADALVLIVLAAVIYPVLTLFEHWSRYSDLLVEKSAGEVKTSLLFFYLSQAALVILACGIFSRPYMHIASTAVWGFGDTAAAIVGGRCGRRHFKLKSADEHKTLEGSAAMLCAAFVSSLVSLLLLSDYPVIAAIAVSAVVAASSAYTELVSRNGIDTVSVPACAALIYALAAVISGF